MISSHRHVTYVRYGGPHRHYILLMKIKPPGSDTLPVLRYGAAGESASFSRLRGDGLVRMTIASVFIAASGAVGIVGSAGRERWLSPHLLVSSSEMLLTKPSGRHHMWCMATYTISPGTDRGCFNVAIVGNDGVRQTMLGFKSYAAAEAWVAESA